MELYIEGSSLQHYLQRKTKVTMIYIIVSSHFNFLYCKMETILSTTIINTITKQKAKDYLPTNQAD